MAKEDKKASKKEAPKKAIGASAKDMGFQFGVPELADALGIEPASVRVALRNKQVAKNGNVYGWKSQKDFDSVVKQLKAKPERAEREAPAKTKAVKEAKPAEKKASKPATKKSTKGEAEGAAA